MAAAAPPGSRPSTTNSGRDRVTAPSRTPTPTRRRAPPLVLHPDRPRRAHHAPAAPGPAAAGHEAGGDRRLRAGYVTVATVMGLENMLDRIEGFTIMFDRERGRDPGSTTCACSATRAGRRRGAGGSADTTCRSTPGRRRSGGRDHALLPRRRPGQRAAARRAAGPAAGRAAGSGRELVRALAPGWRSGRCCCRRRRRTSSAATGPGSARATGDPAGRDVAEPVLRPGPAAEPAGAQRQVDEAAGLAAADHRSLALTAAPKGLPAAELDAAQRELLRSCWAATSPGCRTRCHRCGATPTRGRARRRAPGLGRLDRARGAELLPAAGPAAAHRVRQHAAQRQPRARGWRDPEADFGLDVLAAHRAAHHS